MMVSQLKNEKSNFFLPLQDLNHSPLEPNASVLPLSYTEPLIVIVHSFCDFFHLLTSYLAIEKSKNQV